MIPTNVAPFVSGRKLMVIGSEVTLTLTSVQTGGAFYTFTGVFLPGMGVPPHVHQREDEVIHVLEGELEVMLDGALHRATAGSVLYFPRHIPHGFRNVGESSARAFFVVSPGKNFEQFFEELSALPAHQPPEMPKVLEIFGRYGLELVAS